MADPEPDDPRALVPAFPDIDPATFPAITPGGSLLLAWQVRDQPVLLVGGGTVAASRLLHLLNASALVTLVAPPAGLHPETAHRILSHPSRITYHPRLFRPTDVTDPAARPSLVLTALDDPATSAAIHALCVAERIPVNVADVPPLCDFYFGAVHRSGPLQIMVSTNGNGPRLAAAIKSRIAASLPENISDAINNVGELRKKLRAVAPGADAASVAKRMGWMTRVCDEWSFEQLATLTPADMDVLLRGYDDDTVKSFDEVAKVEQLMAAVRIAEAADASQ